jgi:hypothetical protein
VVAGGFGDKRKDLATRGISEFQEAVRVVSDPWYRGMINAVPESAKQAASAQDAIARFAMQISSRNGKDVETAAREAFNSFVGTRQAIPPSPNYDYDVGVQLPPLNLASAARENIAQLNRSITDIAPDLGVYSSDDDMLQHYAETVRQKAGGANPIFDYKIPFTNTWAPLLVPRFENVYKGVIYGDPLKAIGDPFPFLEPAKQELFPENIVLPGEGMAGMAASVINDLMSEERMDDAGDMLVTDFFKELTAGEENAVRAALKDANLPVTLKISSETRAAVVNRLKQKLRIKYNDSGDGFYVYLQQSGYTHRGTGQRRQLPGDIQVMVRDPLDPKRIIPWEVKIKDIDDRYHYNRRIFWNEMKKGPDISHMKQDDWIFPAGLGASGAPVYAPGMGVGKGKK